MNGQNVLGVRENAPFLSIFMRFKLTYIYDVHEGDDGDIISNNSNRVYWVVMQRIELTITNCL